MGGGGGEGCRMLEEGAGGKGDNLAEKVGVFRTSIHLDFIAMNDLRFSAPCSSAPTQGKPLHDKDGHGALVAVVGWRKKKKKKAKEGRSMSVAAVPTSCPCPA